MKKARVPVLLSEKVDFKVKNIMKDKEGHFIIIKDLYHQEDKTILKFMHLIIVSKYMKQKLDRTVGEIDKPTTVVRNLNATLSIIDKIENQ